MTIFPFYISAQIPNIESFEAYGGLQALGGISSFFSLNFPSNAEGLGGGTQGIPQGQNFVKIILPYPQRFCHPQRGSEL